MAANVTTGKALSVMSILATNVDWESMDPRQLQKLIDNPKQAGRLFSHFLTNTSWSILDGVLDIDRSIPFDPTQHPECKGWEIVHQDEMVLGLDKIDLRKTIVQSYYTESDEDGIYAAEWLERIRLAGHHSLDAKVWELFKLRPSLIPKEFFLRKEDYFNFAGTIFKNVETGELGMLEISLSGNMSEEPQFWMAFDDGMGVIPFRENSASLIITP